MEMALLLLLSKKKEEEKEEKYVGETYIQEKKAAGRVSQPSPGIQAD